MSGHPERIRQHEFDPLGPEVHATTLATGHRVHFIDDGPAEGTTLLFFGGAGTSVRTFRLMEFARTLRLQLGIRVVSAERNGLGQTPFDPAIGLTEHARDVWALLDELGVPGAVSLVAVSGGGPYAAHVALARPDRVRSLHLACALSERLDLAGRESPQRPSLEAVAADPAAWWDYPQDSPVRRIPGFADSAVEEATRSRFALGRDTPPDGLAQAFDLYRDEPMADLSEVRAPAFGYWGSEDPLVPTAHLDRWRRALGGPFTERVYPGESHDVQYRHWDQILTDVATLGEHVLLTHDGCTELVPEARAEALLAAGATPGLAAWAR